MEFPDQGETPPPPQKLLSLEAMAEAVRPGMTVAIGGFLLLNKPLALVREIAWRGVTGLTVVACHGSLDLDLLIGCGCVERLIAPYVGFESLASVGPSLQRAARAGAIEICETDAGTVLAMLRAGANGLPWAPAPHLAGTDLPRRHPLIEAITQPDGRLLPVAKAVRPDIALLQAARCDDQGNVAHGPLVFADPLIALASKRTFVLADSLGPSPPGEVTLPGLLVEGVCEAPDAAQPLGCVGGRAPDEATLRHYLEAARQPGAAPKALIAASQPGAPAPVKQPQPVSEVPSGELSVRQRQALFIAGLLRDGDHVVVGTNLAVARAGALVAQRLHAPRLALSRGFAFQSHAAPADVGGFFAEDPAAGAEALIDLETQFTLSHRVDLFFIGAMQVDAFGNSNLAGIPAGEGWKVRGPGPIGTTTFAANARRYVIMLSEHSPRTLVAEVAVRTAVGFGEGPGSREALGLPGGGPVAVITPLAVLDFAPESRRLRVRHTMPGVSSEEAAAKAGFPLPIAEDCCPLDGFGGEVLAALAAIDPAGVLAV